MASFYVLSLYFWSKQNRFNRQEPKVIKRRFISVTISSLLSIIVLYIISKKEPINSKEGNYFYLNDWIGFRLELVTTIKGTIFSIRLTIILFIGPVLQNLVSHFSSSFEYYKITKNIEKQDKHKISDYLRIEIASWFTRAAFENCKTKLQNLCFLRNYVVSPFTEELVFRSCMVPLLVHNLSSVTVYFVTPLFFGLAHLHHIVEDVHLHHKSQLTSLIIPHLFQFTYTYVFGVYSSFLFIRTGSFFGSFLSHVFCNYMGFPNFEELFEDFKGLTKYIICFFYLFGLIAFSNSLFYLTLPEYFGNKIYGLYTS
jgi:prenyl protein peptidase